ncbi:unnamed protein product [Amaranthus hypochondriacus]
MEFKEKTRKTRGMRKKTPRSKETKKKKGEKVQQVINDGTRNVRKRKFKHRKEAIRKNNKKEKIRKKKRMKVQKKSESVGGGACGSVRSFGGGRVAKWRLLGRLQQRGRTIERGHLGSCGEGSGGGPGGRRWRGMSPKIMRKGGKRSEKQVSKCREQLGFLRKEILKKEKDSGNTGAEEVTTGSSCRRKKGVSTGGTIGGGWMHSAMVIRFLGFMRKEKNEKKGGKRRRLGGGHSRRKILDVGWRDGRWRWEQIL